MLTAFLLGLALGATAAARAIGRRPAADHARTLAAVLLGAGLFSLATAHALLEMPRLFAETYFRLDPSPDGWFLVQLGVSLLIMFPTTFALGWVFPLVLELAGAGRGVAASVGRVYAANTAGTIAGAAAGGFLFLPRWGVNATLLGVAVAQGLLAAWVAFAVGSRRRMALATACLAAVVAVVLLRPSWDVLLMNSGVYVTVQDIDRKDGWRGYLERVRKDNQLVYARDGLTSSVLVGFQPISDNLYLAVNGKTDASSREDLETQIVLGHLPLLIHREPKDILVIGLASGISAGSVACHPVEHIKIVEVEAAMIPAARLFREHNGDVLSDPRVTVSVNDARNELQFNDAAYDVIISEPSNPWMTVASNLFTEDFFRIARARLKPGGIFTQWIQTYGLGPREVRSILASFRGVFPETAVFETLGGVDLVVLGSAEPLRLDEGRAADRMARINAAFEDADSFRDFGLHTIVPGARGLRMTTSSRRPSSRCAHSNRRWTSCTTSRTSWGRTSPRRS
jgi:spermidine synthase